MLREKIFKNIVDNYSERLYWHIRRMVNSHDDANDILQDVYLKIWEGLPAFREESGAYTWAWRIATNAAISFIRRERLRSAFSFKDYQDEAIRKIEADPYTNGDTLQRELAKAVAALPEKQRQVFVMRWWDELPYKEISAITGTSEGALKASYHIAEEKVKKSLNLSVL